MNAIGASVLAVLILVVLCGSRKWALLGMMAGVLFLTEAQGIDMLGFNMFPPRFLELAGFIRVLTKHEFSFRQLNKIDYALLFLYIYTTVVFLLRSVDGQTYQIGIAVDAFFSYFTFRGLLGDMEDFRWFLRAFVFLLIPYVLLVVIESITWNNPFALLGNINDVSNWTRHGRLRCFGSFRQPDTLGMFAASFVPLYVGLACIAKERKRALLAICLCLVIVWAANCGGAAAAAGMGLIGWVFWRLKTEMRKVRWSIVAIIAALALVMKAPVWYIFARISSVTGGDGWQRSYLLDISFQHFGKWWLAGMPISETIDWFPYQNAGSGAADITNQFISFGMAAGVGAIILFILLLTRAFGNLGKALAVVRSNSRQTSDNEFMLWGLGVMLAVHIVDWFGITYFDQMYLVWFMQLAAVASFSEKCIASKQVKLKAPDEPEYKFNDAEQVPAGAL